MKLCTKCRFPKEPEEFAASKYSRDGLQSWCRECKRLAEEAKRRRLGAPARITGAECPEGYKECLKCNFVFGLDDFSVNKNGSHGRNSYCKVCEGETKPKRTPEKQREYEQNQRLWNRPWRLFLARGYTQKRRARLRELDSGQVTIAILRALYTLEYCTYCKFWVSDSDRTIDHVVPLIRDGLHHPDNLVMACKSCNSRKQGRDLQDFLDDLERELHLPDPGPQQAVMRFGSGDV